MPEDKDKRKTEVTEGASDDVNDEEDEEVKEAIKSLVGDDADDQVQDNPDEESEDESPSSSSSSSESEEEEDEEDNSRETNIRQFSRLLDKLEKERQEEMKEEDEYETLEEQYDFPEDPEKWTEADLQEYWADAPESFTKPGWDPITADKDDWDAAIGELKEGRDPPIAPFYVPFHKSYPAIPDNHYDIKTPKAVVEELDRIEEFLKWVSVIFRDGSSYEGTVWDDLAHGKGVYVAERGLVRYEGEWFRNAMEGHGILEVDIPDIQPRPGSKLEVQMRSEGKIISTDYMSPEDKKWLEMDIEDSLKLAGGRREIPFYENDAWVKVFGEKPEKGRYKYAGQMKHGRMHGCGVYEVNERVLYGRFYFGEYLDSATGCDADISALHAGIAEVAAAKARMFANKPDGMIREDRGPYSDPQHPYFYEQDDVWMAPGFINQFYEVPDYWKTYVEDVDQEREMWLNSFYKAPLRIPMPAELEYWWEKDESPEFILINKEPEPDPEDPSKLVYTEDPLILHTRSGRLINYVDDEKYGVRLFWQPPLKEGEDIDPEKVQFLPVGFDEYYGRAKPAPKKENWLVRLVSFVENALKPMLDKIEKWTDEKKKESELNLKLIETELELVEAEICLEEEVKDLEMLLKKKQQEEEKAAALEDADTSVSGGIDQIDLDEGQEEVEDEEAPSSFGTVSSGDPGQGKQMDAKNGSQPRKSPFSSLSLSFGSSNVVSAVPNKLRESFMSRKEGKQADTVESNATLQSEDARCVSICYPQSKVQQRRLQAGQLAKKTAKRTESRSRLNSLARILWSGTLKDELPKLKQNTHPFQLNLMSIDAPLVNSLKESSYTC